MPREKRYYVYIMSSKSRVLYVGVTGFLMATGEEDLCDPGHQSHVGRPGGGMGEARRDDRADASGA
jgi:hypothetical protein